ncbi:uncharacterized mitochondrial protein AtMg00810-like [Lolium perenne]|uniref:uncharacterized mitochondrial protein AtMg00810-like n=1 Tax=Lolium perenne TaxID=4522 RepID=UPI003A998BDF
MYKRGEGSDRILLGIYVDDLIITGSSESGIITFKEEMKETFRMSDLGKLSFYLGLEVLQSETGITVTQLKLSMDSTTKPVDATELKSTLGSLRYLIHTRPDIMFAVGYLSRFMEQPTKEHQAAVKHVLRYITDTLRFGRWEYVEKGKVEVKYVSTDDQLADILTKPLGRVRFQELRSKIGMVENKVMLRIRE